MVHEEVVHVARVSVDAAVQKDAMQLVPHEVRLHVHAVKVALGQALGDGAGVEVVEVAQAREREVLHVAIRHVGREPKGVIVALVELADVGLHLLGGNLEGVADVVEERGEPPVFEEVASRGGSVGQAVACVVGSADGRMVSVDGEPYEEHVGAVRVVVAMLHEKRAGVGFVLGE